MPKIAKELSPLAISKIKNLGWHAVGHVAGLGLKVSSTGTRSWVMRVMVGGKRREFGLGSYPTTQLASARDRARSTRDQIFAGNDPSVAKREAKSALMAAKAKSVTFKKLAEQFIEQHESAWKNSKHAAQWVSTLETYAFTICGNMVVSDITTPVVLKILEPIWTSKTETASRLRGRIEAIIDYAIAKGLREGPNPARWKGHLALTLPAKRRVSPVVHHKSIPVEQMPPFFKSLKEMDGTAARALEFLILTAARSGEVREMLWDEVDLKAKTWTIPAQRMKGGREHRVPLSNSAIGILKNMKQQTKPKFVFEGNKVGKPLSDMSLTAVMRRMNVLGVPHGLRASFRNWTAEKTSYPNEVAEMALAHTVGNAVEAAYRRGDLFEKRRTMMKDWATYLSRSTKRQTTKTA
jgi:integrase